MVSASDWKPTGLQKNPGDENSLLRNHLKSEPLLVDCNNHVLAQVVPFAGVLGGVATLSADAKSLPASQGLSISLYKPENGPAVGRVPLPSDWVTALHEVRGGKSQITNANDLAVGDARAVLKKHPALLKDMNANFLLAMPSP